MIAVSLTTPSHARSLSSCSEYIAKSSSCTRPARSGGWKSHCNPRLSCGAAFNFAPAGKREEHVHGCRMPGFTDPLPGQGKVGSADVQSWSSFMKQQGVDTVVVLLGEDELAMFSPPLLEMYQSVGMKAFHLPASQPGAVQAHHEVFKAMAESGGKVVVHCTGGCHRVGAVLTGWLAHKHGYDYATAVGEMSMTAAEYGVNREAPSESRFTQYMTGKGW